MSSRVTQIAVPPDVRRLSTLDRVDYADAFTVELDPAARRRNPEQWARAILDGAPAAVRAALVSGWLGLGLRLGPPRSDAFVSGWRVRRSTKELALLGSASRIGMPAELLVLRRGRGLLFSTFVEQDNPLARSVWRAVEPLHRPIVRRILEQGTRPSRG
jgi:hypothetical protein